MARFTIDDETADKGYLYVDVDNIATLIIRRAPWDSGVHIEICPYRHAGEHAVKTVTVSGDALLKARARTLRKKSS
jgi:hypothetical protein